jgi:hypothetical protein
MGESAAPVRLPSNEKKIIYVEPTPATGYLGTAAPGAATSDPVWRIQRLSYSGNDLTVEFAEGNAEYDNVWDDRAGLTYS